MGHHLESARGLKRFEKVKRPGKRNGGKKAGKRSAAAPPPKGEGIHGGKFKTSLAGLGLNRQLESLLQTTATTAVPISVQKFGGMIGMRAPDCCDRQLCEADQTKTKVITPRVFRAQRSSIGHGSKAPALPRSQRSQTSIPAAEGRERATSCFPTSLAPVQALQRRLRRWSGSQNQGHAAP